MRGCGGAGCPRERRAVYRYKHGFSKPRIVFVALNGDFKVVRPRVQRPDIRNTNGLAVERELYFTLLRRGVFQSGYIYRAVVNPTVRAFRLACPTVCKLTYTEVYRVGNGVVVIRCRRVGFVKIVACVYGLFVKPFANLYPACAALPYGEVLAYHRGIFVQHHARRYGFCGVAVSPAVRIRYGRGYLPAVFGFQYLEYYFAFCGDIVFVARVRRVCGGYGKLIVARAERF